MKSYSRKWLLVVDRNAIIDEIDCLHITLKHIVNNGFYAFVHAERLIYIYVERNYSPMSMSSIYDYFHVRTYASVSCSREQMIDYLVSKAGQCGGTYYTSSERWFCHE